MSGNDQDDGDTDRSPVANLAVRDDLEAASSYAEEGEFDETRSKIQEALSKIAGIVSDDDLPVAKRRRPEKERIVWVEMYPGGDAQIEIGGMDAETLYLQPNEVAALREILNEFPEKVSADV